MTNCNFPNAAAIEQAQSYLKSQGVTLSEAQLRELTARLHGYENLAAMPKAVLPTDDPAPDEEDLARVCMQYEAATGEPGVTALALIKRIGLPGAIEEWNNNQELCIRLGPCVIRCESETGFWNENQGWVFDKRSATGYPADYKDDCNPLKPDAKLVAYGTALDFREESDGQSQS
jgi:hypothetical protein